METLYLSREGHRKLKEKLDYMIKVKRKEITKTIAHAREFGDLKENAEYHAAKEAQALNEIQINELSTKLTRVQLIDDLDIPADKAYIGATVKLLDLKTDDEFFYILVSESEADFMENKISISSPIGKGLLGKSVSDVVKITVPVGELNYKITGISRDND
ncbi:transcription elongation factor GreA [bacterium]|nr:transcription elongation factor GreA [bacterium]